MDEENENENIIIINIGTSQSKVGRINYGLFIVPTCSGYEKPKYQESRYYWNRSDYYKTINKNYSYPIKNGIITDFNEIKNFFNNIFENNLRVLPEYYKFFITQPIFNPRDKMEELARFMFDYRYGYEVPALYI